MKIMAFCLQQFFLVPDDDFRKVITCNGDRKEICATLDGDQICHVLKDIPENGTSELFVFYKLKFN